MVKCNLRVSLIQPIQWIHLDAVYPYLPVEVCAGNTACSAHQADHLTLLDHLAHTDQYFRLVPKAAVHAPAVIDDGRIAAYG